MQQLPEEMETAFAFDQQNDDLNPSALPINAQANSCESGEFFGMKLWHSSQFQLLYFAGVETFTLS